MGPCYTIRLPNISLSTSHGYEGVFLHFKSGGTHHITTHEPGMRLLNRWFGYSHRHSYFQEISLFSKRKFSRPSNTYVPYNWLALDFPPSKSTFSQLEITKAITDKTERVNDDDCTGAYDEDFTLSDCLLEGLLKEAGCQLSWMQWRWKMWFGFC